MVLANNIVLIGLGYYDISNKDDKIIVLISGTGGIRTPEVIKRLIYSQVPLCRLDTFPIGFVFSNLLEISCLVFGSA